MGTTQPLTYPDEHEHSIEDLPYSSEYEYDIDIESLAPKYGNILCITDPSKADIYINGILQPQQTSTLFTNILIGNYTVSFVKTGYTTYTEIIIVRQNLTTTVASILNQIANITDRGIVICSGLNISTCPISPITCPILTTPLDYINLITTITSISPLTLIVRFIYTLDGTQNYTDIPINLATGNNIVYAFPLNIRYSPNVILSLDDVMLI